MASDDQEDRAEFGDAVDDCSAYIDDVKDILSPGSYRKIVGKVVIGIAPIKITSTKGVG